MTLMVGGSRPGGTIPLIATENLGRFGHYFHRIVENFRSGLSLLLVSLWTLWINCGYLLYQLALNACDCYTLL